MIKYEKVKTKKKVSFIHCLLRQPNINLEIEFLNTIKIKTIQYIHIYKAKKLITYYSERLIQKSRAT